MQQQTDHELERRYEQLEDFFENGAVALHIVAPDGTILRANKAELELLGYTADEYIGRHIADFHADQSVIDDVLKRLTCGEKLDKYPARLRAKDGSVKHVLISSSVQFHEGKFINTRCFTVDVTERVLAEQARREREQEYRQLIDALPVAVYTTDANGKITYYNDAACELAWRRPSIGDEWCVTWRLYRVDGTPLPHNECPMAVALKENRAVRGEEAIAERPDGTRVPFAPYPTPLRDASGRLIGAVNMLIDLSERKLAEETQRLLIEELNHRVKNTLATVQALAQQTQRRAKSPEHFVSTFNGRIQALARAHNLLSDTTWKGAELSALIKDQLLLNGATDERVSFAGPALSLAPQTALHMALVIHELATNARKYGALSVADGRVSLNWSLVRDGGRVLRFSWVESGSREIQAPGKPGFGTFFIEEIVKPDGGEARVTYGPYGITWDITLRLTAAAYVDTQAEAPAVPPVRRSGGASLKGKRVLVIEDEPLIALELSQTLADAGLEVVGVARTVAEAHRAVSDKTLDLALLDGNLAGERVDALASALTRSAIPFAFITGYGRSSLPAGCDAPIVHKPFTAAQLLETVTDLVRPDAEIIELRPKSASRKVADASGPTER